MASVNKVILVGNLGRDPEIRAFPSGEQVANASLATTSRWKDKQSGEVKEQVENFEKFDIFLIPNVNKYTILI